MMIMFVLFADPGDDDDIGIDLDLVDGTTVLSKLIIVGCVYILYAVGFYRIARRFAREFNLAVWWSKLRPPN